MKNYFPWYVGVVAVLVVVAFALGAPVSSILVGALVLVCPLMMALMMGQGGHHRFGDQDRDSAPKS